MVAIFIVYLSLTMQIAIKPWIYSQISKHFLSMSWRNKKMCPYDMDSITVNRGLIPEQKKW